jgi:DNA-binding PadR family transcriptional regulator
MAARTVEDPVEYQVDGVTQVQVAAKVGLTFAAGHGALWKHAHLSNCTLRCTEPGFGVRSVLTSDWPGGTGMSAKYAVLGLVIERPGYGYQLAQRLEERFGSSGFAASGVYSALDQLTRDDFVRSAGEMRAAPAQRAAPRMIYEATPGGLDHFESWMLGSSRTPPLRDELHMKIALCQPHNLPRLIETVYGQELACLGRLQDLKRSAEAAQPAPAGEWPRMMRVLVRDAEVAFWDARIVWLQSVRESLERLREESERRLGPRLREI